MPTHRPSHDQRDDLTGTTKELWSSRSGCELTDEDARECIANVAAFFDMLAEWETGVTHGQTTRGNVATVEKDTQG